MKRVILTGATGFIGVNLADRLLREGHQVHLLVRPGYAQWRLGGIKSHVSVHESALEDSQKLPGIIAAVKPEWIFHLAAYGAYSWQTDTALMVQTNIMGTIKLLEACLKGGFEAFINTGSSSEYGSRNRAPAEREWLDPNSCYAVTKAAGTHFCRYAAQSAKAHVTTLRLYSVYGPYEEPGRFIPALILNGLGGKLPPLAAPDSAHDYVYVEDVCDAYLLAASRRDIGRGAVYNVGTGVQTTLRSAVETARCAMRVKDEPKWGSMRSRLWDSAVWVCDSRLIQRELGWKPRFSFAQGFQKTVEWFSARPELLEFYRRKSVPVNQGK